MYSKQGGRISFKVRVKAQSGKLAFKVKCQSLGVMSRYLITLYSRRGGRISFKVRVKVYSVAK